MPHKSEPDGVRAVANCIQAEHHWVGVPRISLMARWAAGRVRSDGGLVILLRWVALFGFALVVAACSGGDDGPLPSAADAESTTTSEVAAAPEAPVITGPDEAEVAALWAEVLAVFEEPEASRVAAAEALEGRVPVDAVLEALSVNIALPEAHELTSNARFTATGGGEVEIADCTDSSLPTLLGRTTAGFVATAGVDANGGVVLTRFEPFPRCVQAEIADAVLAAHAGLRTSDLEFWDDPRIDHPNIEEFRTDAAIAERREVIESLAGQGQLEDLVPRFEDIDQHVEIVLYTPGDVRLRICEHGDENFGTFNSDGERVDDLEPPWQTERIAKMVEVDGQWLFDELISRNTDPCDPGTTAFGLRPL